MGLWKFALTEAPVVFDIFDVPPERFDDVFVAQPAENTIAGAESSMRTRTDTPVTGVAHTGDENPEGPVVFDACTRKQYATPVVKPDAG